MACTLVKWSDPAAELRGIAQAAAAAVARHEASPRTLGFAVPNRTWAMQLAQALAEAGLPAAVTDEPFPAGTRRAAIMDFRRAWTDFSHLYVVGCVEGLIPTAQALAAEEAAASTGDPADGSAGPAAADPADGPAGSTAANPAADPEGGAAADPAGLVGQQRAAFNRLAEADGAVTFSYFAKAPAALADQIHLPYRRTKAEDGIELALVSPARFIAEWGAARPSTQGGDGFLRAAGLN